MDWNAAIETNREALKRIMAALVAMAGLGTRGQFTFFPQDGSPPQGPAHAEKSRLSPTLTLPRRLHNAVLRLLRPAEAAARRLVIVAARGLVVTPLRQRKPGPKPVAIAPILRSLGIAVFASPAEIAARAAADRAAVARSIKRRSRPARLAFPLFDPSPRWSERRRCGTVPAHGVPRILFFDGGRPPPLAPQPSPDDLLDATRLGLRVQALGRVLDDLPAQAKRFARWRAGRDAAVARNRQARDASGEPHRDTGGRRIRRIWPLRLGRPPGGRLSRYDPDAFRRKNIREVDEVLAHAHALAVYALEQPDTS